MCVFPSKELHLLVVDCYRSSASHGGQQEMLVVLAALGTRVDGGTIRSGVDGGAASTGVECTNVVGVGLEKFMTLVNHNYLN